MLIPPARALARPDQGSTSPSAVIPRDIDAFIEARPVILAGGRGTRLAPFTSVIPKPLIPIGDEPIIDVLLTQLHRQGWNAATVSVGHMADLLRAYCGDGDRYGVELEYVEEVAPLGTVGPLALLPPDQRAGHLLVMNGDLLTDLRFGDLVRTHAESGAAATIAVKQRPVRIDYGVLDLAPDLSPHPTIVSYREKPAIDITVSIGVYVFSPEAIAYVAPGERLDLPELIERLLGDGVQVHAYPHEGYWLDIGQPPDYAQAIDDFAVNREEILGPCLGSSFELNA